jgi:hypothetical protein
MSGMPCSSTGYFLPHFVQIKTRLGSSSSRSDRSTVQTRIEARSGSRRAMSRLHDLADLLDQVGDRGLIGPFDVES